MPRKIEFNTRVFQRLNERVDDIATRMDLLMIGGKKRLEHERKVVGISVRNERYRRRWQDQREDQLKVFFEIGESSRQVNTGLTQQQQTKNKGLDKEHERGGQGSGGGARSAKLGPC
jgi:hypothetical protein